MPFQQKKKNYFHPEEFIQKVLNATGMDKSDPRIIDELTLEITTVLMQRMSSTIIDHFAEKELFLLEKLLEDHPELDEIDAIVMIANMIPSLNAKLEKTVQDLYLELVQDYQDIDQAIKSRK